MPRANEEDQPEDLFDSGERAVGALETLPMPTDRSRPTPMDRAARRPAKAWEKGGPSPNRRGRPPKTSDGPVTRMLQEVIQSPDGRLITKREMLDRQVLSMAVSKGGRWSRLWDARQQRDRELNARLQLETKPTTGDRLQAQSRTRDFVFACYERIAPGYLKAYTTLLARGVIQPWPDGIEIARRAKLTRK